MNKLQSQYWELPFPEIFFDMDEKHSFLNYVDMSKIAEEQFKKEWPEGHVVFNFAASRFIGQIEKHAMNKKYRQDLEELLY